MINLLPIEDQKDLRKYYKKRLINVVIWALAALILILAVMKVPAFLIFSSKAEGIADQIAVTTSGEDSRNAEVAFEQIQSFRKDIKGLTSSTSGEVPITEKIRLITNIKPRGVSIESISARSLHEFEVRGSYLVRQDLIDFIDSLKTEITIYRVDSELSNLISETDGAFVIRFFFVTNEE